MPFFSWFSKKPHLATSVVSRPGTRGNGGPPPVTFASQGSRAEQPAPNLGADISPANVDRKVKRHARREQLYAAIRDAMTRAGMLSASYKFKVLSLDQNGNQFLVMMDMAQDLATTAEQLSQAEEILVQAAKSGYGIVVTSVYWRVDRKTPVKLAVPPALVPMPQTTDDADDDFAKTQADASDSRSPVGPRAADVVARTRAIDNLPNTRSRHDPLLEAEVAAFKRALAVAPAAHTAAIPAADADSKVLTGAKSYALITGFEDTEMPDSPAMPALSATQYGELN